MKIRRSYLFPVILTTLFALGVVSVSAQDNDRASDRAVRGEEKREEMQEKREEMQAKRVEFQRDIAERKVDHTARVMLAAISRLERIADRIESRIARFGEGTEEAQMFVDEARESLSSARSIVETLAGLDLSGETAQDNFTRIRTAAHEAKELIRSAHGSLKDAVRVLRGLADSNEDESESSDEDNS